MEHRLEILLNNKQHIMRNKLVLKSMSLIALMAILLVACKKEKDTSAGGTATQALAGEFWVQIKQGNTPLIPDYFKIVTYNTAEDIATSMWIDDQEHLWPFKVKISVDPVAKTFAAANAQSSYGNITVKINNGKILEKVTKGPVSNVVTDSIYFEAEFSDDPGEVYQLAGYRRTRWPEDDHE
jgi:Lipid-binding putative hydrolase